VLQCLLLTHPSSNVCCSLIDAAAVAKTNVLLQLPQAASFVPDCLMSLELLVVMLLLLLPLQGWCLPASMTAEDMLLWDCLEVLYPPLHQLHPWIDSHGRHCCRISVPRNLALTPALNVLLADYC
jgi:hypothetical protein